MIRKFQKAGSPEETVYEGVNWDGQNASELREFLPDFRRRGTVLRIPTWDRGDLYCHIGDWIFKAPDDSVTIVGPEEFKTFVDYEKISSSPAPEEPKTEETPVE